MMNRRSMQNVKDDRAWAFDPANIVDRSPDYRMNFPLDNKPRPTPSTQRDRQPPTTPTRSPASPTGNDRGLDVHNFVADYGYRPASEAYLAALDKALPAPLPRQLSARPAQPAPGQGRHRHPTAAPRAPAGAVRRRGPATVVALAQQPVKLVYLFRGIGRRLRRGEHRRHRRGP